MSKNAVMTSGGRISSGAKISVGETKLNAVVDLTNKQGSPRRSVTTAPWRPPVLATAPRRALTHQPVGNGRQHLPTASRCALRVAEAVLPS